MDGILSGFGFSSKKQPREDKNTGRTPTNAPNIEPRQGPDQDGDLTQGSKDQPLNDRNPNMRLSKNTPSKSVEDDFEIPSEPSVPSFNSSSIITQRSTAAHERSQSAVIGPKITFKGELTGEEDLLIQGTVEGTIDLKGYQLTVGAQGTVKANLKAKIIIIEGTVEGDLIGQERIEIKASSNVKGNLIADRVTLEDGAKFRGSIDMDNKGPTGNNKYSTATGGASIVDSKSEKS